PPCRTGRAAPRPARPVPLLRHQRPRPVQESPENPMPLSAPPRPVRVLAAPGERHDEILTPAALDFVARLADAFTERRDWILKERRRRAIRLATGTPLDFSLPTSAVRNAPSWRVAPPAPGLADRRVEITGPPADRRMAVNA